MTITTTAPATTADVDLITALDAGLLPFQTPSADLLAILNNKAIASGIERGIIAAQAIERIIPDGVEIEEINCGREGRARALFLHRNDEDDIALYFFDRTTSVSLHIDADDPAERRDEPVSPAEMFEVIRAYYGS